MARFTNSPKATQPALPLDRPQAENRPAGEFRPTSVSRPAPGVRPNKFGGKCGSCGGYVEAEQGRLDKVDDKWVVSHHVCPEATSEVAAPEPTVQQTTVNGKTVFDGDYTLQKDDGDHRTFRLSTQALDSDFMPGVQVVAYLSGADNENDYTRFGHVQKDGSLRVWSKHREAAYAKDAEVFWADPFSEDVLAAVRCYACGRKLTVPASVHNGYGPECAKRV